ncbi:MAG: bifunctional serine/threonine-protein kinase/formylglycine-generating enzyme family protein [Chloroflexota bacterium]
MSIQPLKTIGKYDILKELGRGGFALVYQARDPDLERVVALKVLAAHLTWDPTFAQRFRREAQTTASLDHPHIVTVYEVGEADGQLYLAMTYLPGRTLAQTLQAEGAMSLERALSILEPIADALDYAHRQGVIHRDIKPSNIMLQETERGLRVTLMDFGLVKAMESSESLTSIGTILGSPEYMAPEQADPDRRSEIGPATDRYALGVVAYQMLAGRVPFPGSTPSTLVAHMQKPPPDPQSIREGLAEDVARVLLQALAKAPAERYPTAMALVEALRRAQVQEKTTAMAQRVEKEGQPPLAEPTVEGKTSPAPRVQATEAQYPPEIQPARKRFPAWGWAAAGVLVLVLVAAATRLGSTPAPEAGATQSRDKDGAVMVYVPAGAFWMGSDDNDPAAKSDEKPQHEITLDAFWIDRTEVTNGQYRRCVDDGACSPPYESTSYSRNSYYGNPEFDDYPVVYVDWNQAGAYCAWAGARLPSEAEWEKAARGTDKYLYPWGNDFDGSLINFCDVNCTLDWQDGNWDDGHADTAPVGSYPGGASPFGALDMAGNVWEWVADWYAPDYYAVSPASNPQGPDSGNWRAGHGGSWSNAQGDVRAAYRDRAEPSDAGNELGFRCARSP